MSENQTITDSICGEYSASQRLRIKAVQKNEGKEGFEAMAAHGAITVKGFDTQGAIYGASLLGLASESGRIGEFLDTFSPSYPLRPLWLGGQQTVAVTERISVAIPSCFTEDFLEDIEDFCRRVIEFGFNSIILGARTGGATFVEPCCLDLKKLEGALRRWGLKVIIKPAVDLEGSCPVDSGYVEELQRELTRFLESFQCDAILWESRWTSPSFIDHPIAERYTLFELVAKELGLVERAVQRRSSLIFFVTSPSVAAARQQCEWLGRLCDEAGDQTTLAFSAVAGNPHEDWRGLHPVWKSLQESVDVSHTPLLPIVNVGCVGLGEGLWPLLSTDSVDEVLMRMECHRFAGMIAMANHLPSSKGLLACSLFAAGQALWRRRSARLSAEMFLKANHPQLILERFFDVISEARRLSFKLFRLRARGSDSDRLAIEELLTSVKAMEAGVFDSVLGPLVYHFTKDIKRMIVLTAKALSIPCPNVLGNEDHRGGFWTRASQGAATPATVTILDTPIRDEADSVQAALFDLNRQY